MNAVCHCQSYKFPHRAGGGACHAHDGPFCGDCGKPAIPVQRDFGIGRYEYWGSVGTDRDVRTVSSCCDANLFSDADLTKEYCDVD